MQNSLTRCEAMTKKHRPCPNMALSDPEPENGRYLCHLHHPFGPYQLNLPPRAERMTEKKANPQKKLLRLNIGRGKSVPVVPRAPNYDQLLEALREQLGLMVPAKLKGVPR